MIDEVKVNFTVSKLKDVPKVGTRKVLFVNGKREWMHTKSVSVSMSKEFDDDGHIITVLTGTASYTKDTWN